MKKVAMFVFNGDPICFIHVLLNALDMKAKGSLDSRFRGNDGLTDFKNSQIRMTPFAPHGVLRSLTRHKNCLFPDCILKWCIALIGVKNIYPLRGYSFFFTPFQRKEKNG